MFSFLVNDCFVIQFNLIQFNSFRFIDNYRQIHYKANLVTNWRSAFFFLNKILPFFIQTVFMFKLFSRNTDAIRETDSVVRGYERVHLFLFTFLSYLSIPPSLLLCTLLSLLSLFPSLFYPFSFHSLPHLPLSSLSHPLLPIRVLLPGPCNIAGY